MIVSNVSDEFFYKTFGFETIKTLENVAKERALRDWGNYPTLTQVEKDGSIARYRDNVVTLKDLHNLIRIVAYLPIYNIALGFMMLFAALEAFDRKGSGNLALRGICTLVGGPLLLLVDIVYEVVINRRTI